jgi:hypothetical protein
LGKPVEFLPITQPDYISQETKEPYIMGAFDPNSFLEQSIDQPLVKRPPIPVGDYIGLIGDPDVRDWVSPKDPTKSGKAVDYPVEIQIPADVVERLNLRNPTLKLKLGIMLDLTPSGGIDQSQGANGGLRKLREALDLNKPGDSFNLRKPVGRTATFKIKHREYPEGSGDFFEDIAGVAKA